MILRDAIADWVDGVLNPVPEVPEGEEPPVIVPVPWVWANEKGMRPKVPYLALNLITQTERGGPSYSLVDVDPEDPEDVGIQTIRQEISATLSIQAFYSGGESLIHRLRNSLKTEAGRAKAAALGISVLDAPAVKDISSIIDESPEHRWLWELTIGTAEVIEDAPGYIANVDYTGSYAGLK